MVTLQATENCNALNPGWRFAALAAPLTLGWDCYALAGLGFVIFVVNKHHIS